jgi:hypothetical protein
MRTGTARLSIAVAAVAVLAACSDPDDQASSPPAEGIVVVGDSITALSTDAITAELSDGSEVTVLAAVGKTFESSQPNADLAASEDPSVAVIALGTNDVWRTRPIDDIQRSMDEMLAKFDGACVIMVNLNENARDAISLDGTRYDNDVARQVNALMRERVERIVDWNGAANADRARYLDRGSIHPTEAGADLLASMMGESAATCPG